MDRPATRYKNIYWASLPTDKVASEAMRRIEDYYQFMWATGKILLYRNSYQYYFRPGLIGGKMTAAGSEGELTVISINHFRNFIQHLLVMTCNQPINWEPQAVNTDQKSQEQCILGKGLLEYYQKQKRVERVIDQATEFGLLLGDGFVQQTWDATDGEEYGVIQETGAIIREGDVSHKALTCLDCIRDVNKDSAFDDDFVITRTWKNRWDLMAKYPELAAQIVKITDSDWDSITWKDTRLYLYDKYNCDDIPVYTLFHRQTEAMPQGRMVTFLNGKVVLDDGPIPYRRIPVYRLSPSDWLGTPFGYTTGYDLLPVQQLIDALASAAATNNCTFGVQNVWTRRGDPLETTSLAGGMKHLQSDVKPESLNLTQSAPELYKLMEMSERWAETISGVNAVARGNPEQALGSDASGAAMALIQSMAIQFSMGLQKSRLHLVQDVGTGLINLLRDYATVPRIAAITGKANRQYLKSFTGDDLSQVNRVSVDMGNPAMNTTAGNVNMANQLLQADKLADADQYIEVVNTGKVEPVTENETSMLMNVRGENERLTGGQPVRALISDNHPLHIKEHLSTLDSPESRDNPMITQAVLNHCQEHRDLYSSMDPLWCQIIGIPPPPPPLMPPGMMGMPGMPPPPMAGPPGPLPPPMPPQPLPGNPIAKAGAHVKGPQMPHPPKGTPPGNAQIIQNLPPPPMQ